MDYRSCEIINKNFKLNKDGTLLCVLSNQVVTDSVCRAYVFANMFFYDYVDQELGKIYRKLDDKKNELIDSANIPPEAVEKLYPPLSNTMKEIVGNSDLDGLIKRELSKVRPHISLILTPEEEENLKKLQNAIFVLEYDKFKKTVMVMDEEMELQKELDFTNDFLKFLTPRGKRLLAPAIKMTALLTNGMSFNKFVLSPEYNLKYTWARNKQEFNEEEVKDKIKEIMSAAIDPNDYSEPEDEEAGGEAPAGENPTGY
jgi:hypothetical protein